MPVETIVIEGGTVVSNVRLGQKRHFDRAPATVRHPLVKWCSARPDLTGDMRSIR